MFVVILIMTCNKINKIKLLREICFYGIANKILLSLTSQMLLRATVLMSPTMSLIVLKLYYKVTNLNNHTKLCY